MTPGIRKMTTVWLLAAGLAMAGESTAQPDSASQSMQVEEPGIASLGPVNPDGERAGWDEKEKDRQDLTPEQKQALEERRQRVKEMTLLIQEKREAIRTAKDGERQALTQELHNLVIEGDAGEKGDLSQARSNRLENRLKQLENRQELLRRKEETRDKVIQENPGNKTKPKLKT